MKVRDVMTTDVATVGRDATFQAIVALLTERDVSGVPVVDDDGALVGIVTEADLAAKIAFPRRAGGLIALLADRLSGHADDVEKARGLRAGEIMTAQVVTAGPDESVTIAARRMLDADVKALPVVADGRVVGIVSRRDLLPVFSRSDEQLKAEIEGFVRGAGFEPPAHDVAVDVAHGVVTLRGRVYFRADRDLVEAIVTAVPGVIEVVNRLDKRFDAAVPE